MRVAQCCERPSANPGGSSPPPNRPRGQKETSQNPGVCEGCNVEHNNPWDSPMRDMRWANPGEEKNHLPDHEKHENEKTLRRHAKNKRDEA